jgi:magnesium transporter
LSTEWKELVGNLVEDGDNATSDLETVIALKQQDTEEVALLLESLPIEQRLATWRSLDSEERFAVLLQMRADPRERILDDFSKEELDDLLTGLDASELLELADSLSPRLIERALNRMDEQQQQWYLSAQQYNEAQGGHWARHDTLALPQNARVRDALRLLRRRHPEHRDTIFLTDRVGKLAGCVLLSELWAQPEHISLAELVEDSVPVLQAQDAALESALKVQTAKIASLPMVDAQDKLIGCLDITTACELVNEFHEAKLMASAGMDENEDLFGPVRKSAQGRAVWLGINLLTAFAASWFIGLFEATLQQVVALAVLMPVVASMGGISGSQTLTLMIRGLALRQVSSANRNVLLKKELSVGLLNGVIWATVVGIVASLWFSDNAIGLVIGVAILLNIVAAALSGVIIPVVLDKLRIDPALSGSVILTTVTDIVGFVAFLGLGTLFLV